MTSQELWRALLSDLRPPLRLRLAVAVDLSDPPEFKIFALNCLRQEPVRRPLSRDASLLLDAGLLAEALRLPRALAPSDASALANEAMRLEPLFDVRLIQKLTMGERKWPDEVPDAESIWLLDILSPVLRPDSRALLALLPFMKAPNPQIRARAVRLIARLQKNEAWFLEALNDADARVRANLLDAAASQFSRHPAYVRRLLEVAALDREHRPATTALFHLALAGDEPSHKRLRDLLDSPDSMWQRAAAAMLIKLGDPGSGSAQHRAPEASLTTGGRSEP